MKKFLLTTALLISAGITVLFAQTINKTAPYLPASFHQNFNVPTDVSWKQTKNFTEATVTIDNRQLTFFYTEDHHLIAVSRNILTEQLPLALLGDLKMNYKNYWIAGLFELSRDGNSEYYLTLENKDGQRVMKSDDAGEWIDYRGE